MSTDSFRRVRTTSERVQEKVYLARRPLMDALKEIDKLIHDSSSIRRESDGNVVLRNLDKIRESVGRSLMSIDSSVAPFQKVSTICKDNSSTESDNG